MMAPPNRSISYASFSNNMATGGGSGPGSGNGPPMSGFGLGSTFPLSMGNISVMSGPPSSSGKGVAVWSPPPNLSSQSLFSLGSVNSNNTASSDGNNNSNGNGNNSGPSSDAGNNFNYSNNGGSHNQNFGGIDTGVGNGNDEIVDNTLYQSSNSYIDQSLSLSMSRADLQSQSQQRLQNASPVPPPSDTDLDY